ncbi:response regulator/GGDEF domain protein [Sorangium cellulosum So ce56]|uniref:diguanylate cyclase n=1 Tax=Sorangium cellulosum (strain So ce56) TaxID=448385 RepID=A9GEF7_SORC5|nr:diguanylate cyclase [Sorangium cellulosum]CAN93006.1 response regulator/GGDEF domain protein [Sorangium cellulosum So ce56]
MPNSDELRSAPLSAPIELPSGRPARIVVADDDRLARQMLVSILQKAGFQVEAVDDGQEAIELIGRGGVDLVLLDIVMPRLTGLEACRLLKSMTSESFLPVVLVTVKSDTANRVEGLKIGADDYVCKPFEEEELLARVGAMLRIKRLHDQVAAQRAYLEQLSIHDEMTGLYNYRYLFTRLNEEFKRAERYHEPFACVLVDIDRLKVMNETGGRTLGDAVIRRVADGIRRSVREVDVVARYGGEEFLIVLPSTHFAGSLTVAERIWREAAGNPVEFGGEARPCSVSIGVALYPSRDVRSKDGLIRAAESALNQAKREGGNRICVFQQHGQIYTPAAGGEPQSSPPPGKLRRSSDPAFAATHAAHTAPSATDEPREPQTRRGTDLPPFASRKPL